MLSSPGTKCANTNTSIYGSDIFFEGQESTEMPTQVLLVEDSPGDIRLTQEAFREVDPSIQLHVANDGVEAMAFLRGGGSDGQKPRPDFILLDLNLPKMEGTEVLTLVKGDPDLRAIPTFILTTSKEGRDIAKCYALQANCYLCKPVELDAFENLVKSLHDFWLKTVELPKLSLPTGSSQAPE
jgi:chemotaxis family two-component system response regulator Rcp1